ncbi:GNAT family N-acetyltransferase [Streptococcus sobrinus]|uniref:GNAT family N-acetyltransferase n=1 Tax=Streptococcus sobrinus TaxID=1310 RepID=UPI0002F6C9C5|nr:GNAT family N-acetyltransferase [Streptococcus sobrinus]
MKILGPIENNSLPDAKTKRLYLRQRTVADAKDMLAYVSLPQVAIPAAFPLVETLEDEIDYIEKVYPQRLLEENLPAGWGITLKGQDKVIGSVDFNKRHGDKIFEIGYTLHPDYWGQGYIPEACQALLEVGFNLLDLDKVLIQCYDYNRQSQRVAEKLGFSLLEKGPLIQDPAGRPCHNWTYQLTKEDWVTRG